MSYWYLSPESLSSSCSLLAWGLCFCQVSVSLGCYWQGQAREIEHYSICYAGWSLWDFDFYFDLLHSTFLFVFVLLKLGFFLCASGAHWIAHIVLKVIEICLLLYPHCWIKDKLHYSQPLHSNINRVTTVTKYKSMLLLFLFCPQIFSGSHLIENKVR